MKYTIQAFILIVFMFSLSSCKTKKEIPVVEEEKVVSPNYPNRDIPVATAGKAGRSERFRKPKIDPEQVIAQLGLSEAQEKPFLDFWEKNQAEMDKLRSDSGEDRMAMRDKMKAFRETSQAEIEKILTPEQYVKYKRILAEDRMKSRRGN
ncbi:MAG: hypothetical protein ACJA1A_003360 [Saprospiraceae bacterium]|jgi:hypothetical protein|tara:strand:+ start:1026 stop:1475 length:450 start_codon:yes stop_codon:yes gene_type:complete